MSSNNLSRPAPFVLQSEWRPPTADKGKSNLSWSSQPHPLLSEFLIYQIWLLLFRTCEHITKNWLFDFLCHVIDFLNPVSDARADLVGNIASIKALNDTTEDQSSSTPGDIVISTSSNPMNHSLQEFKHQKPPIPASLKKTTGNLRQAKRLASSEVKKSPQSAGLGMWTIPSFKNCQQDLSTRSDFTFRTGGTWYKFEDFQEEKSESPCIRYLCRYLSSV